MSPDLSSNCGGRARSQGDHEQLSGGKAAAMDRPLHLALASSAILSRVVGERWLAVSDTGSACDPLLSQGIMKALHDGVAAARDRHMHGRAAKPLLGYQEDVFARFR
jgi:hypothetical protein